MQGNDDLDSIIDRALSKYSDAEPLAGLEERVLNRIRGMEPARPRFRGMRWALVFSMLSLLILIAIAVRTQSSYAPGASNVAVVRTAPTPPAPTLRTVTKKHTRAFKSLPKKERFPASAPITSEERALLAFVKRDPIGAQRLFAELERRTATPIEIEELQLEPLDDGSQ